MYEGYKLIEELDGINNNAVLRRYVWQPLEVGSDVPLSVFDAALGATYYYHTDGNKNVIAMTDSNGSKVASYTYDAFGYVTSGTGSYAATNPFRFSSEFFDTETGLIYYNFRYYTPLLGRWLTRDPIAEQGGLNLYNMCDNNTINYWDVNGLTDMPHDWRNYLDDNSKKAHPYKIRPPKPEPENNDPCAESVEDKDKKPRGAFDSLMDTLLNWNEYKEEVGKKLDQIQAGLDAVGLIPGAGEGADLANGLLYLGRGDLMNAAASFGAMIPMAGDLAKAPRMAKNASNIADAAKNADRITDVVKGTKTTSNSWNALKSFRGDIKTNGLSGKKRRYFQWDHTHGDIEVYDNKGRHLGSMKPDSNEMYKAPVNGRKLKI